MSNRHHPRLFHLRNRREAGKQAFHAHRRRECNLQFHVVATAFYCYDRTSSPFAMGHFIAGFKFPTARSAAGRDDHQLSSSPGFRRACAEAVDPLRERSRAAAAKVLASTAAEAAPCVRSAHIAAAAAVSVMRHLGVFLQLFRDFLQESRWHVRRRAAK